jgi:hypothetical protein
MPTTPMPALYEPTLCLVAQGQKRAVLGDAAFTYDPSTYLIASVELPVVASVIDAVPDRPYLCLQLHLDTFTIAKLAMRFDALAPSTLREIFYRLLGAESGAILRQMARANSRLNQIARVISWIRTHFRENFSIEQTAAEIAGISRSTFHAHFKAVTAMSPLKFRTQLRMQEAQRLRCSAVRTLCAFQRGILDPSQSVAGSRSSLAAHYRQTFSSSFRKPSLESNHVHQPYRYRHHFLRPLERKSH